MYYVRYVLLCLFVSISKGDDQEDEICCAPRFIDSMRDCKDLKNEIFDGDELQFGLKDDPRGTGNLRLSGSLGVLEDLEEGYEIELAVYRLMDLGKEYVYGAAISLCESLKSESAPWYGLVKSLNVTSCPVKKGSYKIQKEVSINLDFAKDAMNHNFCGEYEVEMTVLKGLVKVSCHVISLEIYEKGNV